MTVSSEELSGVRALEVAARALRMHEMDAAFVGAVDMSCDPVHRQAARGMGIETQPADGAVVLVLKRLEDALSHGDRVLALIDSADGAAHTLDPDAVAARWGAPHQQPR